MQVLKGVTLWCYLFVPLLGPDSAKWNVLIDKIGACFFCVMKTQSGQKIFSNVNHLGC